MANRFKKSLEMLETEAKPAEQTNRHLPGQKSFVHGMDMVQDKASEPNISMKNPAKQVIKATDSALNDIFGEVSAPRRQGEDATFYLSYEVITAVSQIAIERKISKSKVVDKALRQVLMIK